MTQVMVIFFIVFIESSPGRNKFCFKKPPYCYFAARLKTKSPSTPILLWVYSGLTGVALQVFTNLAAFGSLQLSKNIFLPRSAWLRL
jgi:hypothetical protein